MKIFDTVIIGGGPAGLSAAIYLGRFLRNVLVVDKKQGRSTYPQINENYLGFPTGIPVRRLRKLGRQQAEKFGVEFIEDDVTKATKKRDGFYVHGQRDEYIGKTIIIATGVRDFFPIFDTATECVGKSLFWCITCDGHKVLNKKMMIVGNSDDAVITALQFCRYTKDILFITNCHEKETLISREKINRLHKAKIPFFQCEISKVEGEKGYISCVTLDNGERIFVDFMFSLQGAKPNSELAVELGVTTDIHGYIKTNSEQRTNIPYLYAAGDVTKLFSHQVVTAAHEGSMAAQAANYDLYAPEQRH